MTKRPNLRQPLPVALFGAVALAPLGLFALGLWLGGAWVWAGFLYMTLLTAIIDRLIPHVAGDAEAGQEFPCSDLLLLICGLSALALLPLATWAVAGPSGLSPLGRVLIFLGAGLWLGQVGHPAAHELIHRPNRWLFRLGLTTYAVILFGQHASAHRLVHHRFVATAEDPNSAPDGMGFYAFYPRAWIGSFRKGRAAETELRRRASGRAKGLHPYWAYLLIAIISLSLAYVLAGWAGLATWIGLANLAQAQILLSDYVQHYGLRRPLGNDGKPAPVSAAHSWNAAPWFSSALLLNAPRHSDHHVHPSRPFPALRLGERDEAPRLPWPLPLACTIALFPPLWRRAIRPALRQWHPRHPAASAENSPPKGAKTKVTEG